MRPRTLLLLAGLGLALPVAASEGWSKWAAAFPSVPCGDGWLGCRVGTSAHGPAPGKDAAGRPVRADLRLAWFDLAPTAAFSPFGGLSGYAGSPAAADVLADGPPVAPPPEAPPVEPPPEAPPPTGTPTVAQVDPTTPPVTRPVGGGASSATSTSTSTSSSSGTTASTSGGTGAVGRPPTGTSTPPATAEAGTVSRPATGTPQTDPTTSPGTPVTNAAVAATAGPVDCSNAVSLEPTAMLGKLSTEQVRCVEGRLAGELPQTTQDKLSRVLIVNAENKGDKAEWERLVKRHLESIDRSDPTLCYKYALHISRGGVSRANGVIRWADYALENKQRWSGPTYKSNVYALYKLKAEAAAKLWAAAEQEFTTGDHSDEAEAKAQRARGVAKDYAKEWLDYARTSGQDTATAMKLCVSAAGNREYCDGG